MEDEMTCPQCSQSLFPEDSVVVASDGRLSHLDCRAPRALTGDERFALICYCFDHAVADCARCGQTYREIDLVTDYLQGRTHLCPGCRADLTERSSTMALTASTPYVARKPAPSRPSARFGSSRHAIFVTTICL